MYKHLILLGVLVFLLPSVQAISYLHGNGLAAKLDSELEFYHTDSLGSTRTITNEAAEILNRQKSLPFGGVLEGTEKYGFTGKELDESGLQYFGARYYDSSTGTFISTDPALQYHSPYTYAGNNPLAYKDPDGRSAALVGYLALDTVAKWGIGIGVAGLALEVATKIDWSDPGYGNAPLGSMDEIYTLDTINFNLVTSDTSADATWTEQFAPGKMPVDMTVLTSDDLAAWRAAFPPQEGFFDERVPDDEFEAGTAWLKATTGYDAVFDDMRIGTKPNCAAIVDHADKKISFYSKYLPRVVFNHELMHAINPLDEGPIGECFACAHLLLNSGNAFGHPMQQEAIYFLNNLKKARGTVNSPGVDGSVLDMWNEHQDLFMDAEQKAWSIVGP